MTFPENPEMRSSNSRGTQWRCFYRNARDLCWRKTLTKLSLGPNCSLSQIGSLFFGLFHDAWGTLGLWNKHRRPAFLARLFPCKRGGACAFDSAFAVWCRHYHCVACQLHCSFVKSLLETDSHARTMQFLLHLQQCERKEVHLNQSSFQVGYFVDCED